MNDLVLRTMYHQISEYTFLSGTHEIFMKSKDVPGHKENLDKFQHITTKHSLFSDHNSYSYKLKGKPFKSP